VLVGHDIVEADERHGALLLHRIAGSSLQNLRVKACRKLGRGGKAETPVAAQALMIQAPARVMMQMGFVGGRRFGSGKQRRWFVACGKDP